MGAWSKMMTAPPFHGTPPAVAAHMAAALDGKIITGGGTDIKDHNEDLASFKALVRKLKNYYYYFFKSIISKLSLN